MVFLSTLLISLFTTIVLIPALGAVAGKFNAMDIPDERKVHERPIPRTGGIAMAAGAIIPVLLWAHGDGFVRAYLAGAAILVCFGIVDDCRGITPKWKFLGQFAASLVVIFLGGLKIRTLGMLLPGYADLSGWVSVPLTMLAIMGVTNAINLADGLDGLAGGICLLIFCTIGFLAYLQGDVIIGLVCLAMAGAIFGFLRYNTHPATVFMGDTGSQLLGFSAITLSLDLTQGNTALSPILPLFLLGIPVLDTLLVMILRLKRRKSPFSADKNHIHHHLMALGLHHGESVIVIYTCQAFLVVAAYLLRYYSDWMLLGIYLGFSVAAVFLISVTSHNEWNVKSDSFVPMFPGFRYMKDVKQKGNVIRTVMPALQVGPPLLLFFTCLLPSGLPAYAPYCTLGFAGLIAATWALKWDALEEVLRVTLYLFIPFAVYESSHAPSDWAKGVPFQLYNGTFFLLAMLVILGSKLSRRQVGFKSTPLDFLIFFLALVVPNLPEQNIQAYQLGKVGAKIVIFYFSYEVLMVELQGKLGVLALWTGAALVALSIRAIV
ncbi:MAG: glycosyl transferase [candidate division Zixibacteria bacterium RBG_16_53_22]|nr:MAG: glycosyl transferase [candidate division Zixibacteria bacterium RBG_16_53_22]